MRAQGSLREQFRDEANEEVEAITERREENNEEALESDEDEEIGCSHEIQ